MRREKDTGRELVGEEERKERWLERKERGRWERREIIDWWGRGEEGIRWESRRRALRGGERRGGERSETVGQEKVHRFNTRVRIPTVKHLSGLSAAYKTETMWCSSQTQCFI
jgi:hypothetical protein